MSTRSRRSALAALLLIATLAALVAVDRPRSASAGSTFTVDSTTDATDASPGDGTCNDGAGTCTLRAAIQEANALPGSDTITLPAGEYTLTIPGANEDTAATGDLDITDSLTINGAGAPEPPTPVPAGAAASEPVTTIDGARLDRVIHIDPFVAGVYVAINAVTIQNGSAQGSDEAGDGGGIDAFGGTLVLQDSAVRDNNAERQGGGISSTSYGTLTLFDSLVTANTATGSGGGIFGIFAGVYGSTISGNSAPSGGGIAGTELQLSRSVVSGNTAVTGGGIELFGFNASLTEATVAANTATREGGGIWNYGNLTLSNVTLRANAAPTGGGLFNLGPYGNVALADVTISANSATSAGAFYNSGTTTIKNSVLSNNVAASRAGGMDNVGSGGISGAPGTATLTNVTISRNAAAGLPGGGISNGGSLHLLNVTVADNLAPSGAGIARSGHDVLTVNSTAVADNSGGNCSLPITSGGHNLDSDGSCGFASAGDLSAVDPLLGPLADNSGPTQTHALLAGSPAIDAGDNAACPSADQRGVARPQDGDGDGDAVCDIGAYEAPAAPPKPPARLPPTGSTPGGPFSEIPLAFGVGGLAALLAGVSLLSLRRRG